MFLFSATFFPLSTYPPALRLVVEITPLYQGVAVLRALLLGAPDAATVAHLAYLVVMGAVGLAVARRQLARILLH
jgi:lipooligosaccharide transport system permease protein